MFYAVEISRGGKAGALNRHFHYTTVLVLSYFQINNVNIFSYILIISIFDIYRNTIHYIFQKRFDVTRCVQKVRLQGP